MPHIIVDHSKNLTESGLNMDALLTVLSTTAVATGLFPESGLRARAIPCEHFRVGNGNPNNGFVNVSMRVGKGRDIDARQAAGQTIFEAFKAFMAPIMANHPVALSFEMRELDEHVKFNFKNT